MLRASHFDLVARVDAETPRVLAVTVEVHPATPKTAIGRAPAQPHDPVGSLLGVIRAGRKRAFARAEMGFLLRFQIDKPRVVKGSRSGA